jgi:serine/threonine protein kinase/biopolymer transport protein ExbD
MPKPEEDLTEKVLGEFRLLRRLGVGGMAEVYLAEQTALKRKVAVKVMKPDMVKGSNDVVLARFKQEAMAAAGLNHPSIVQVYTIGNEDGYHYIAQEYVQGKNLAEFLKAKGTPDLAACLHIMRHVAAALKAAGEAGIVHRDIKPENIMLSKRGEVKVADFGLAQLTARSEDVTLTQQGMTLGTPLYMSPEQVTGADLDHRSDLYSFGVTCFHMLCGRPPFRGESAMQIAVQHVRDEPPELKSFNANVPTVVAAVVHKLMQKNPEDRYENAGDLLKDIRALARGYKDKKNLNTISLPVLGDVTLGIGTGDSILKPLDDSVTEFELKPPGSTAANKGPSPSRPIPSKPALPDTGSKPAIKSAPTKSSTTPKAVKTAIESKASRRIATAKIATKPGQPAKQVKSKPAAKTRRVDDDEEEFGIRKVQTEFEEMDLTPMVDVTFLLLIFFMITASFSLQKAIQTPAPDPDEKGAAATPTMEELQRDSVIVFVDETNTVYVDDEPLSDVSEIESALRDKIGNEQKTELVLEASPEALHENIVIVIDAAKEVGMQRIRKVHRTD